MFAELKKSVGKLNYPSVSILTAIAAFGAYTCMYAFRKAFAAGTFPDQQILGLDYKVWLVIAQVLGYTLSKFYGIRFISSLNPKRRGFYTIALIAFSWLALLGFALIPSPYNIICMFFNGLPLGLIWGLVFGYLEGRRATEFMAAILSVSLIFASGFVKTIGRLLILEFNITEFWMPFLTGLCFVIPLLVFVLLLESIPSPDEKDIASRTIRLPMTSTERKDFLYRFLPGIIFTVAIYMLLTVIRDLRDNFEVEIWADLGYTNVFIYSKIDTLVSILVLIAMASLVMVKNHVKAFKLIHWAIIIGCLFTGLGTLFFNMGLINPVVWMTMVALGLYLGYIPYNAIFFERMIAAFKTKSNVGFIMYIADAMGYLGSISVLLFKEFSKTPISWGAFFKEGVLTVSIVGGICVVCSLIYFSKKSQDQINTSIPINNL
ncbi:MAG: hypothetical protein KKG25_08195 [Bacteroidetes bacterium]|nr:hypothetical protein [Bacteroidota bacterium]MBU1484822.1 hypothetical protein [Bacteroidota bacterium]